MSFQVKLSKFENVQFECKNGDIKIMSGIKIALKGFLSFNSNSCRNLTRDLRGENTPLGTCTFIEHRCRLNVNLKGKVTL